MSKLSSFYPLQWSFILGEFTLCLSSSVTCETGAPQREKPVMIQQPLCNQVNHPANIPVWLHCICYHISVFMHVLLPVKFLPLPYKNTLNRFICACINVTPTVATINTFHARLIQAFRVKTACSHVALHEHNSGVESPRELFKGSKDSASLVVCNDKKFSVLGFGFFVSDVIRGGLLGHFGPLHLALGPNR